jgi:hypothetical protein
MRKIYSVFCLIAATACWLTATPGADVTGTWAGRLSAQDGGTGTVQIVLQQSGDQISGTAGNWKEITSLSRPMTATIVGSN